MEIFKAAEGNNLETRESVLKSYPQVVMARGGVKGNKVRFLKKIACLDQE